MNRSRCLHCGIKLGNHLYAGAGPHCCEELQHNHPAADRRKTCEPQHPRPLGPMGAAVVVIR